MNDSKSKSEMLNEFLVLISSLKFSREQAKLALEQVKTIYSNRFRHSYSELSKFLLKSQTEDFHDQFVILVDRLRKLKEILDKQQGKSTEFDSEELRKGVAKLYDHVNLELIRMDYFTYRFNDLYKSIDDAKKLMSDSIKEVTDISERSTKAEEKIEEIKQETFRSRNQYITILGIFASIVITVFAGLSISSSIITSVHNSAVAKLCFFSCLTGFIVFNILVALFCFLTKINNIGLGNKYWILVIVFNIFMIIGAFGSIWAAFSVPVSDIGFSFFFKSTP